MRLFAQLGWYFRREWHRYVGAVLLLIIIAILQLIPPKLVGVIVDDISTKQMSTNMLLVWIGVMLATAVVVYCCVMSGESYYSVPLISWRWS